MISRSSVDDSVGIHDDHQSDCLIAKGFTGPWWVYFFRFVLLFSYITASSVRWLSRSVYGWTWTSANFTTDGCSHDIRIQLRSTGIKKSLALWREIRIFRRNSVGFITQSWCTYSRTKLYQCPHQNRALERYIDSECDDIQETTTYTTECLPMTMM